MVRKPVGGVGVFGWTLLGFLAGIAATLALQMLLMGVERGADSDGDTRAPGAVVVAPKLPAPTISRKRARTTEAQVAAEAARAADEASAGPRDSSPVATGAISAEAPAKPKPKPKTDTPDAQVYDDAAAAGMTSRAAPQASP